jgi:putative transport protein
MPFDELLGIASGVTGNPAILAYADKLAPTDRPDLGYAVIFRLFRISRGRPKI